VGVLLVQGAGVLAMSETAARVPGALRSLRPRVTLPSQVRVPLAAAGPVIFASWALGGFYASLGPSLIATVSGSSSVLLGGLGLFVLAGIAAAAGYVLRDTPADDVMLIGVLSLVSGVAFTLLAVRLDSPALFFAGTSVAGVGFGSGFQGGIRTVLPRAAEHERAGVLSLIYLAAYLGLGLPAVLAGYLVVHAGGLLQTTYEYGAVLAVLAAVCGVSLLRQRLRRRTERSAAMRPAATRTPATAA
jgi:hypothetical protein